MTILTEKEIDALLNECNTGEYDTDNLIPEEEVIIDFSAPVKVANVKFFKGFQCEFCLQNFTTSFTLWQEFINEMCCPHCGIPSTIVKKSL
jgi:hypothetical protein